MSRWVVVAALGAVLAGCAQPAAGPGGVGPGPLVGAEQAAGGEDGVIVTGHLRLIAPAMQRSRRELWARVLEASLARSARSIPAGAQPEVTVRVYADAAAWRQAVSARLPDRVHLGRGMDRGAVTIGGQSYLTDIGGDDGLRLAAHEAQHAFVHGAVTGRLPLWLDEALAVRAEGFYAAGDGAEIVFDARANPTRRAHLSRMIAAGHLGSLSAHGRADPSRLTDSARALDDYYARAFVLAVMIDRGALRARVDALLAAAATGRVLRGRRASPSALFGLSEDEAEARFAALAHELAGP